MNKNVIRYLISGYIYQLNAILKSTYELTEGIVLEYHYYNSEFIFRRELSRLYCQNPIIY